MVGIYQDRSALLHNKLSSYRLPFNFYVWAFWLTFIQCYFLDRTLVVLTGGLFRASVVTALVAGLPILLHFAIANKALVVGTIALSLAILISTLLNESSILQFITFVRVPVTTYLVYNLVRMYINSRERAIQVLRWLYIIGFIQLPVLALQRITYPILPDRWKHSPLQPAVSLADFGMGTLNGDTSMTFLLVLLTIVLLFYKQSREFLRWKWLGVLWFTLTIFVGNSEIQHMMILLVWTVYIFTHFRLGSIVAVAATVTTAFGALAALYQFGILTFSPFVRTTVRLLDLLTIFSGQVEEEAFLSGNHARSAAIYYYLSTPIKWFGDGPGAYYNVITREREVGNWGQVFTFYSEIGLIGWLLSILLLTLIAFPFAFRAKRFVVQVSWVQILALAAINVVGLVKYPMSTVPTIFTYCIILVSYQVLAPRRTFAI